MTAFNLIQNATDTGEGSLVFFLFDLLHLDGENLTSLPLVEQGPVSIAAEWCRNRSDTMSWPPRCAAGHDMLVHNFMIAAAININPRRFCTGRMREASWIMRNNYTCRCRAERFRAYRLMSTKHTLQWTNKPDRRR